MTEFQQKEGHWELRGGKFVQKQVMTINPGESNLVRVAVQCPNCHEAARRIASLEESRKHLTELLNAERNSSIIPLRERMERLEIESQTWLTERTKLEQGIKERDRIIEELRGMLGLSKETTTISVQDRLLTIPQTNNSQAHWYYAVQDQTHAQLFQMHPRYCGGDIVVDALEGATVVNPEYYTQSERVPGTARLRIRVVDAFGPGGSPVFPGLGMNSELFVRLRLGSATQFTQPRAVNNAAVAWQQDFVFVGLPLVSHSSYPQYQASQHPLTVEVVARTIGAPQEQVIGSGTVDLSDLVVGLTRAVSLLLNNGGMVNVRIKALDFGLPNAESFTAQAVAPSPVLHQTVQTVTKTTSSLPPAELERRLLTADMADAHHNTRSSYTRDTVHTEPMSSSALVHSSRTSYSISDAELARRLDAADKSMNGMYGSANFHGSGTTEVGQHVVRTTYNVSDTNLAHRLDLADGLLDGKYGTAPILVR